ncbi:MAG: protein kinase [Planctomycetota bacterium]|nr:protein kinase [Planctomycetota bacterium]
MASWASRARPCRLEQVYDLLSGILRGLSAIHQARVFHRDIKPENILLSGATPKISDLGIATMLQTKEQASTTIGTLAYMSPEILGPEGASFSSDLWAVGVTAYEMLTGHWPFGDEETPVGPMVNMILTQEPAPPQQRVPSIPEAVGRVILKALHKDPAERYATPDAMRRDLDLAIRTAKRTVVAVPERPKPEAAPARAPEAHAGEAPDAELAALRAQAYSAQTAPETEAGLKDLARRFPKDARTHAALGEFYNRAMRYAQAVAALKKGLEHDPGNAMAHWHLGLALEKLGRRPEAAQALEAALKAGLDRKLEIHARVVLKHLTS